MSDHRQDSGRRASPEAHVTAARERGPLRSDLSSGGGQVRQSNRSGLSRKPDAGDTTRQASGGAQDDRRQGRSEGSPDAGGAGGKSERTPSDRHGESAQGGDGAAQGGDVGSRNKHEERKR